jgi:hypothetical protein
VEALFVKELSGRISIPNAHTLLLQLFGVGRALDKPDELFDYATHENLLSCKQWQCVFERETSEWLEKKELQF